jgi:hypothetical protein
MIDENKYGSFGGIKIVRETETVGESLPQCHLVHHKSNMT